MSTKKEKCCHPCRIMFQNTDVKHECPDDISCHLQSESIEWEKEWEKVMGCIDECKNGMYEDVGCPSHGYDAIKAVKFFREVLKHQIASAVEARERNLSDTVKKLREDNKIALDCGQIERHIWAGFDEACKYFLSIINPSNEEK